VINPSCAVECFYTSEIIFVMPDILHLIQILGVELMVCGHFCGTICSGLNVCVCMYVCVCVCLCVCFFSVFVLILQM